MFVTASEKTRNAKVYDEMGKQIPFVLSYDTETQEAEIFLQAVFGSGRPQFVVSNKSAFSVKVKIPGSYLEIDGKRV